MTRKWFDNPPKRRRSPSKRRKSRRRPPKGFRSWKAYMASIRPKGRNHMARRKRRRTHKRNAPRRHRRRSVSRRRTRAISVRVNPRRRHVRRYRRRHNPRFSVGGIMGRLKQGAIDGIWIVGGKAVTNAIPGFLPIAATGPLALGIKALAAVGAGYLFGMISPNAGKLATASGFASIYEPFIAGLGIPILSGALAGDDGYGYGVYPDETGALPAGNIGVYPEGVGDEDFAQQY